MKWSRILKPIGLYAPAKLGQEGGIRGLQNLKSIVYASRLKKHRKRHGMSSDVLQVLVVMNDGIGNAVESTPLVQAVRMFWPGCEMTILTSAGDLFDDWCVPDRVTSRISDIEGRRFDHTFLTYSSHWAKPDFLNQCHPGTVHSPRQYFDEVCLKPEREYNIDMIRRLGFKGHSPPLYVSIKEKPVILTGDGLQICLIPGGKNEPRWMHKRWPYYRQLAESLVERYSDCAVYIIGTKDDDVDEELLSQPYVKDLRGTLTLRETAWVLRKADIAVGNDCGPMHIADAVGTTGVVLFGPSCDLKNSPRNKIVSIYVDLPCRPCQYNGPISCQEPKCIQKLDPEIVMKKIETLLKKT